MKPKPPAMLSFLIVLAVGGFWLVGALGADVNDGSVTSERPDRSEQCLLAVHAANAEERVIQERCTECDRRNAASAQVPAEPSANERRIRRWIETLFPWWTVSEAE